MFHSGENLAAIYEYIDICFLRRCVSGLIGAVVSTTKSKKRYFFNYLNLLGVKLVQDEGLLCTENLELPTFGKFSPLTIRTLGNMCACRFRVSKEKKVINRFRNNNCACRLSFVRQ